jgi:hypothetical protein
MQQRVLSGYAYVLRLHRSSTRQPVRARALVALIDEQVRRYGPRGPQLRATLEAHARGEISGEEATKLLARLRAERDQGGPSIH